MLWRGQLLLFFSWKGIWNVKAPQRVSLFVWTTVWRKILTWENLRNRDYTIYNGLCQCHKEKAWRTTFYFIARKGSLSVVKLCIHSFWNPTLFFRRVNDLLYLDEGNGWINIFSRHLEHCSFIMFWYGESNANIIITFKDQSLRSSQALCLIPWFLKFPSSFEHNSLFFFRYFVVNFVTIVDEVVSI